jgi:large subunit ribosomal protein L31
VKPNIHPEYVEATVVCACGNTFQTRATKPRLHVEVCSKCHPFFTGEHRIVDTAGRVERFLKRYGLQEEKGSKAAAAGGKPVAKAKGKGKPQAEAEPEEEPKASVQPEPEEEPQGEA